MAKYDQRLAVEMLKTITTRMKSRAENRAKLKQAEKKRLLRAKKRGLVIHEVKRKSVGLIDDAEFGMKALQISLKEAFK